MGKLSDKAKTKQVAELIKKNPEQQKEQERVTNIRQYKEYPRSFLLDEETINVLQSLHNRINQLSPKKISNSKIIRALIQLSSNINDEQLINTIRQLW
ncbi:MAG: hypothetical protein GY821_01410 [Gammaproteobacteria bacterium]|nr:hypothetical protein [Gammaproteobacteria bacterium]